MASFLWPICLAISAFVALGAFGRLRWRRSGVLVAGAVAVLSFASCANSPQTAGTQTFYPPSILGTLSLSSGYQGNGIAVQGSLAYISMAAIGSQNGTRSLVIASLATPAAPTIVSTTSSGLNSDMAGIVVGGSYAYVPYQAATGTNFQVWDVSNPSNPAVVGSTSISCPSGMYPFQNPVLYGNYVYVSCWESEVTTTGTFAIVDVSNPAAPSVAGSVPVTATYQPISFALQGDLLYVTATQGGSSSDYALLYSIANPIAPSLLASVSVPHSPQWMTAQGTLAAVPIYDGLELELIDFSNTSSPQMYSVSIGSCHPQYSTVFWQNLLFAPCDVPGGLAVVNPSPVNSPACLDTVVGGTVFNYLAADGDYLYGVDEDGNFVTIGFLDGKT